MLLGQVLELWRYPIKSMGGERIDSANIVAQGLVGDRCWAVVDADVGEIRSAKRWPELMNYQSSLLPSEHETLAQVNYRDDVANVQIKCPDGVVLHARDASSTQKLCDNMQRNLRLEPLRAATDKQHYRLASARSEASFVEEMDMQKDEAIPDFSQAAPDIMAQLADNVTPPGSYVDAFPLHLITTDSLACLSEKASLDAVVQRFRPNILMQTVANVAQFSEEQWVGKRLRVGETILFIDSKTVRCSMPGRPQQWAGLEAQPAMARAMAKHCQRHLGVNVIVEQLGAIHVADEIILKT